MSKVTSAVITIEYASGDIEEQILTHEFYAPRGFPQTFAELDTFAPRTSIVEMETNVYTAAFNYVAGKLIEDWFRALPWADGDAATLVWSEDGEARGIVAIGWVSEPDSCS